MAATGNFRFTKTKIEKRNLEKNANKITKDINKLDKKFNETAHAVFTNCAIRFIYKLWKFTSGK